VWYSSRWSSKYFYLRYINAKPVKVNSGYVNNALKNIWIRELNNNKFSEYSDNINEDDDEVYDEQKILIIKINISRLW
jgi:hypothetical protein